MVVECRTLQEATDLLHHCLENGEVVWGTHFRNALADEGLMIGDAQAVLRTGVIYSAPEHDIRTGEWKYKIVGKEPEGREIAIVFSFKTIERVFLITVFGLESMKK
jgi:hypothetical protein